MSITLAIIITLHLFSILFMLFAFKRILRFTKRYRLQESKYTLLLGFLDVPHILIAYIGTMVLFIIGSVYIALVLNSL